METETMREELLEIIKAASAEKVEEIYEKLTENEDDFELTEDDIKELNKRRSNYLSGASKAYPWEEAKEMICNRQKVK